jgi:hypothetical protein
MPAVLVGIAIVLVFSTAVIILAMLIYSLLPSVARAREDAHARAVEVVRAVLTPEEFEQLGASGYLDVRSPSYPGRLYRIPSFSGTVGVIEEGRCVARLCAQPVGSVPDPEGVVVHKLMIEGNEDEYLRTANHFPC